jgi:hypothetical protein
MELKELQELNEKRRAIRPLLSPNDPADALASYYALWHDPRRTQLTLHQDAQGGVVGFIAVCQTGADLFRPLVTMRTRDEAAVPHLLQAALVPDRPYQIIVPVILASAVEPHLDLSRSGAADHSPRRSPSFPDRVTGADSGHVWHKLAVARFC